MYVWNHSRFTIILNFHADIHFQFLIFDAILIESCINCFYIEIRSIIVRTYLHSTLIVHVTLMQRTALFNCCLLCHFWLFIQELKSKRTNGDEKWM